MERDGETVFRLALKEINNLKCGPSIFTSFASLLNDMNVDFRETLNEILRGIGLEIVEARIPSQAATHGFDMELEGKLDRSQMLVIFGCCILSFFNPFEEASYHDYMRNCMREMRAKVNCDPLIDIPIPFGYQRALEIRIVMGDKSLKLAIIDYIVASSKRADSIGSLARYLKTELAWSGMQGFRSICQALVATGSPVMKDSMVQDEVILFNAAYEAVYRSTYPEFFILLAELSERFKVDERIKQKSSYWCKDPVLGL